eukprot:CAMPEP_0176463722 /NCGR_PEP_ID=MMETSP0127-20121128/36066_1 /TAXON_ID=938130 /ORGANISM="Platyophrya macrostoma, Strain WH" /LENGTH=307 /DNA_ID=CAMNT_0017855953 /DNA_START=743 /DNA_END=1666 /DNA_ORIENTATION=+
MPEAQMRIDLSSVRVPLITPEYITVQLNGSFLNTVRQSDLIVSRPAASRTFNYDSNASLQIVVTEYSINSALNAFWLIGNLTHNVTDQDIPPEIPIRLNLKWLKTLIPTITKYYPDETTEFVLNVKAGKAPSVKITEELVYLEALVSFTVYLKGDHDSLTEVVAWDSIFTTSLKLSISNWTIYPILLDAGFSNTSIVRSSIGEFSDQKIERTLDVATMFSVPLLNSNKKGYELPASTIIDFNLTKIECFKGYLTLETTPNYLPLDIRSLFNSTQNATEEQSKDGNTLAEVEEQKISGNTPSDDDNEI